MPFLVDTLKIEQTTFYRQLSNLQYNYKGALAKEKKVHNALKKLRSSVKEIRHHTELFRNKVTAYTDRFKTDLSEGFGAFSLQVRDATKALVKKRDLEIKKRVDMNFAVVHEMLQAVETKPRYLRPDFNPVD